MEAILLAGGLGTRLRSRLVDLPKAMAPVAGRPFLEYLLDRLATGGASRVILSIGHLREVILARIPENYRGLSISFVAEESPLGTGGAIRQALTHAHEPSVLVMNGDTYADIDYGAMLAAHIDSATAMTMAMTRVDDTARYGGVVLNEGRVAGFTEKGLAGSGWINAGTYVLSRTFPWPESLPARFSFEQDVLVPFVNRLRPAAFQHTGFFLDIGIPEDLDRAQSLLPSMR
jgi:D-glycero-alpha-D-manno-heptose 1-phosphate guanylyltransferase